jgi:dihydropteroate synthase
VKFDFQGQSFDFPTGRCAVFGILNVTPDSFSDGGHFLSADSAVAHGLKLEQDGADVIDVGGESTRPGAPTIPDQEEIERVVPVIRTLKSRLKIPLSIDTTKAAVAEAAIAAGASIINDVSGLSADPRMAEVAVASRAGVILMHRRGVSATMQSLTDYEDVTRDVIRELHGHFDAACKSGIPSERIALDPGIGFAKTKEQNYLLLRNLRAFSEFNRPIMIGVSRKSFLGGDIQSRGMATIVTEMWSYLLGAQMIRTHDVAATRAALQAVKRNE